MKRTEKTQARAMRREGRSLREIAMALGVAHSTVSLWVRGIPTQRQEVSGGGAPEQLPLPEPPALRTCSRCRRDLPETAFNRRGAALQWYCRECFRDYYRGDRAAQRARNDTLKAKRVAEARAFVTAVLAQSHCFDCGEHDPVVLEFDHLHGPKSANLATLVARGVRQSRLAAELAQCEVVCANCHRLRTALRARWRKLDPRGDHRFRSLAHRRDFLYVCDVLEASACTDCGEDDIVLLDFDHVGRKTCNVSALVRREASLERIAREIAECEVRCVNCHRRRTAVGASYYRAAVPYPQGGSNSHYEDENLAC